jgi:pancreatic lipase-related protein 1
VVILGWGGGAQLANYFQAASNTRTVGAYTGLVFDNLNNNGGSDTLTWCMGHSLGAHVCGYTGMSTTLQRCTGQLTIDYSSQTMTLKIFSQVVICFHVVLILY